MGLQVYTAFLFPVVDGRLFVGQRNTPPFEGFWGPIGGKNDSRKNVAPSRWDSPKLIEKMGGHKVLSIVDRYSDMIGAEYMQGTAVRECCEELFSDEKFPDDFEDDDFSDVVRVGSLDDCVEIKGRTVETANYIYISRVGRTDFSPSPREIAGFKPLTEITSGDRMFPLAKLALAHMHYLIEFEVPSEFTEGYGSLREQIEPFLQEGFIAEGEARYGDMFGAMIYYPERYFGREQSEPMVREVLDRIRGKG